MDRRMALDRFGGADSAEFVLADAAAWVFEAADLKPSTRSTYGFAIRHFTSWAADRPLNRSILVE